MDTKDIQLFLAISKIGSISKTAEQLFMSQSTVTTRLQRLERDLGYTLFDRLPNGMQLTQEGLRLVPLAENMISLVDRMASSDSSQVPILRLMSGRAFVSTDVPSCLSAMMQSVNIRLQVKMGMYDEMMDALVTRQVDFCFLGEPIFHPQVRQVEFQPDIIDLVVPKGHYFTHHFPGLAALHEEPFIAFSRETAPFRKRVMNLLAKAQVYPNIRMELDSIDGIKAMVAHGLGVSFLPRRTLHDAESKGYVPISIHDPNWTRPTLLAYPIGIEDRPFTRQFIAIVEQHYQTLTDTHKK